MKHKKIIFFLAYLIFGTYLINSVIKFYPMPEIFSTLDKWAIVIGGVLIIMGGFNFLRIKKYKAVS